ncbi:nucleoplasmin-2b [Lepisosteus oculatus]|uniref:nucleoplasmin-2b n=1 Tax=Lepisosteus oculatus TaxID=7918 RepID=UPI0003EA9F4B|nr:PREDICTED: nucleoplasmin-2 [Lepisosteus oculatus]
MAHSTTNKPEKPLSTLWGCELNEKDRTSTFATDDSKHQHQLALRTMCLGADAKDEFNIVELVSKSEDGAEIRAVPLATLKASAMPTVNLSGIDLIPPVTFRLKTGSGPVYVSGEHVALEDDYSFDEDMEEEEEEEEEEVIEESPPKPVKPARKNTGAGKRKKPEKGEEEEEIVSEEENSPPKKGRGRGRKPAAKK